MDDTRFDESIWISRNELVFTIEELEAKNVELEKNNVMLAHQLKYAETILKEVQADKFKLREKLNIAVKALNYYTNRSYLANAVALLMLLMLLLN